MIEVKAKLALMELKRKAQAVRMLSMYLVFSLLFVMSIAMVLIAALGELASGFAVGSRISIRECLLVLCQDFKGAMQDLTVEVKESWV